MIGAWWWRINSSEMVIVELWWLKVSGSESPTGLPRLHPMRERIMINKSAALSFLREKHNTFFKVNSSRIIHYIHCSLFYLRERCPVSMAQTHRKTHRRILGHHSPESRVEDLVMFILSLMVTNNLLTILLSRLFWSKYTWKNKAFEFKFLMNYK